MNFNIKDKKELLFITIISTILIIYYINFNLKSKYRPILPIIAKIPVTIKIATLSTYPKSNNSDVK